MGQSQSFTATVFENAQDGSGFVPAANVPVTFTLANTDGATVPTTTYNATTDANGQVEVTVASPTAGDVVVNAGTSFVLNGVTLTRETGDSNVGDSGPANAIFEDAHISIAPGSISGVNQPQTFTVTVEDNSGTGAGFVPAADQPVSLTLINLNGASTPTTVYELTTNAAGQAQVAVTSSTAGEIIANASTDVNLDGVTLAGATGDGLACDSGPVTAIFADATISMRRQVQSLSTNPRPLPSPS